MMYFRFTFITTMSLILMLVGLVSRLTNQDAIVADVRVFCTLFGTLGWFIGNKLVELEDRLETLEKPTVPADPI